MKKTLILIFTLIFTACMSSCTKVDEDELAPMLSFVENEDGNLKYSLSSLIKASAELDGSIALILEYENGFGRELKVNVNAANGKLHTEESFQLAPTADLTEFSLPLYGKIDEIGPFSVGLTFKSPKESPFSKTISLFANDPLPTTEFDWKQAILVDKVFNNIENSSLLKIPYTKGYGREVTCTLASECGLEGTVSVTLNGNFEENQAGEPGFVEIPVTGNPQVFGKQKVNVLVSSVGIKVEGQPEIEIMENTGKFDLPEFGQEFSVAGHLYKNVPVGVREPVKISIPYKKGFSNQVVYAVNSHNGLLVAEREIQLNAGTGASALEFELEGTPAVLGNQTLTGYVKMKESEEVLLDFSFDVNVLSPGDLVIESASLADALFEGTVAATNLQVFYKDGYNRKATVEVEFVDAVKSGLTIAVPQSIQLAESGVIKLAVFGDAPVGGFYTGKVFLTPEGEKTVSADFAFEVGSDKPAAALFLKRSLIVGTPLTMNMATTDNCMRIFYENGFDRQVKVKISGVVEADESATLAGEKGYVDVPVTGTPSAEFSNVNIEVTADGKVFSQEMNLFAGNKVEYNGLPYYELYFDVNGDGAVNAGEVWLDRNIGATTNDPGHHGEFKVPESTLGNFYYWGRTYTEYSPIIEKDGKRQPERSLEWNVVPGSKDPKLTWNICPEGYRLPTENEWRYMFNSMMGTDFQDAPKGPRVIDFQDKGYGCGLADIMNSPLRFAMTGVHDNKVENTFGTLACYWCSSWFNAGAQGGWVPIRIVFGGDQNNGKANIGPAESKHTTASVRCIRDIK